MEYITIPERTPDDLKSNADINQLMNNIEFIKNRYIFDFIYPINSKYIQLPDEDNVWSTEDEPGSKFGGSWELIYSKDISDIGTPQPDFSLFRVWRRFK